MVCVLTAWREPGTTVKARDTIPLAIEGLDLTGTGDVVAGTSPGQWLRRPRGAQLERVLRFSVAATMMKVGC